jgi:hypothetical protein
MPLVLSDEVDQSTLDAVDFRVGRRSGKVTTPDCASLRPADEENEDRTVLLVGDLGAKDDPPVWVSIVGPLQGEHGDLTRARTDNVVPLGSGPSLAYAERLSQSEAEVGTASDCPAGTRQVVQVVWEGGVSAPSGTDPGDTARKRDHVTVQDSSGTRQVVPAALGDLGDSDNVHDLCLDTDALPLSVSMEAGTLAAPAGDLNPATSVAVVQ